MQKRLNIPYKSALIFTISVLLAIAAFILNKYKKEIFSLDVLYGYQMRGGYIKGVPNYFTMEDLYYKTLLNTYDPDYGWFKFNKDSVPLTSLEINGDSGILVDLDNGNILFEKNSAKKREIASLVKIMTAVVALEHADISKKVTISERASAIGENEMGISAGEVYTVEELLYGLLLPSGNDAAYALAEGIGGNVETFTAWMNIKAKELGLSDTYFADPSGLDDKTYSTAVDLLRLSRYALKHKEFREIVKTVTIEVSGEGHASMYLENQTNLLSTYPGVYGIKTGYTEEAGLCLVTYALIDGKEVVGVVLDSTDRKGDMILMLDYSLTKLGVKPEHNLL